MSHTRFTHRTLSTLIALAACLVPCTTSAQDPLRTALPPPGDSNTRQIVQLRDGSTLVGRITESWGDSARFESLSGRITLRRADVTSVRTVPSSSIRNGRYWADDPNATRLFFAPTGRTLAKGEGYYSNHWIFLSDAHVGITDRFTLGGAMTMIPSGDFIKNNIYFISPKYAIEQSERLNIAAGAFIGVAPFFDNAINNTFGIAYGVATWGTPDASLTLGGGYCFAGGRMADSPMAMLGVTKRLSRGWSFVSENWLFPNTNRPLVSYGLRSVGERTAWDVGFVTILGEEGIVPGVPWLGLTWKFR